MTPTKDDALAALDWLEDILQGCVDTEGEHNEKCRILRAALTRPPETVKPPYIVDDEGNIAQVTPVDVEAREDICHVLEEYNCCNGGCDFIAGKIVEDITSKGYLK